MQEDLIKENVAALCIKMDQLDAACSAVLFAEYEEITPESKNKMAKNNSLLGEAYKKISLAGKETENAIFDLMKKYEKEHGRDGLVRLVEKISIWTPWSYRYAIEITNIFESRKEPITY